MKTKGFKILFALMLLPAWAFCQKAYEAIQYKGAVQNLIVKLTLANGYIGASELLTINKKTGTRKKFLPEKGYADDSGKLKFIHYTPAGKLLVNYFILSGMEESYAGIPNKILGEYVRNRVSYPVKFYKF